MLALSLLAQAPACPPRRSLQPSPNQARSDRLPESLLPSPEVLAARPCAVELTMLGAGRPGRRERVEYRWNGERLVSWRTAEGVTWLSWDGCGRLVRVGDASFQYDARGLPVSAEAAFGFDPQGRLVKERSQVGYSLWTYAPRKVTRLSATGGRAEALLDEAGQLLEERAVDERGAVVLRLLWRTEPRRRVMEERGGDGTLHGTTVWTQDREGRPEDVITVDPRGEPTQRAHYLYRCG